MREYGSYNTFYFQWIKILNRAKSFSIKISEEVPFMEKGKVGVIGAGHVGASTAQRIAEEDIADVVLSDIVEGMPQGKSLDLLEASPVRGYDAHLEGVNDNDEVTDCDVVVITAGVPRKPGMSRQDLLDKNAEIVGDVVKKVTTASPETVLLLVSNPLDVMVYLAQEVSGFPHNRVLGMAGVLDSTRFSYFIANELDVSVKDVRAMVLGGHGDSMVPLPQYSSVNGIPVPELLSESAIERLIERTRNAGGEIVDLMKEGSAFYAPSASITAMVRSILMDEKRILPASTYLDGEYGLSDVCVGVPVKLGKSGVEEVVELDLTEQEQDALSTSADHVKEGISNLPI